MQRTSTNTPRRLPQLFVVYSNTVKNSFLWILFHRGLTTCEADTDLGQTTESASRLATKKGGMGLSYFGVKFEAAIGCQQHETGRSKGIFCRQYYPAVIEATFKLGVLRSTYRTVPVLSRGGLSRVSSSPQRGRRTNILSCTANSEQLQQSCSTRKEIPREERHGSLWRNRWPAPWPLGGYVSPLRAP